MTTRKDDQTDTSALPPVLDVPDAAKLLGIGRTLAYELIRTGQWPTPPCASAGSSKSPPNRYSTCSTTAPREEPRRATGESKPARTDHPHPAPSREPTRRSQHPRRRRW